MVTEEQLLGEVRELYPYFNTDDLANIYNMSRGWTARKIVASGIERRTSGETRALEQATTLPGDVYQVLTTVMDRTGGSLSYTVTMDGSLDSTVGESEGDELTDNNNTEDSVDEDSRDIDLDNDTGSDSDTTGDGSLLTEEGRGDESVDLMSQLRSERTFNNMTDAYNYMADITLQLGKQGIFGDMYDVIYKAKSLTTPPIELGFTQLADLKRTVKNGVEGADWEVSLRVQYLPSYTETERVDEYLTQLQQNGQVYAGRFSTENHDRLSVRVVSSN